MDNFGHNAMGEECIFLISNFYFKQFIYKWILNNNPCSNVSMILTGIVRTAIKNNYIETLWITMTLKEITMAKTFNLIIGKFGF